MEDRFNPKSARVAGLRVTALSIGHGFLQLDSYGRIQRRSGFTIAEVEASDLQVLIVAAMFAIEVVAEIHRREQARVRSVRAIAPWTGPVRPIDVRMPSQGALVGYPCADLKALTRPDIDRLCSAQKPGTVRGWKGTHAGSPDVR